MQQYEACFLQVQFHGVVCCNFIYEFPFFSDLFSLLHIFIVVIDLK